MGQILYIPKKRAAPKRKARKLTAAERKLVDAVENVRKALIGLTREQRAAVLSTHQRINDMPSHEPKCVCGKCSMDYYSK